MNEVVVPMIHNMYTGFAFLSAISDLYSDLIILLKVFFKGRHNCKISVLE